MFTLFVAFLLFFDSETIFDVKYLCSLCSAIIVSILNILQRVCAIIRELRYEKAILRPQFALVENL